MFASATTTSTAHSDCSWCGKDTAQGQRLSYESSHCCVDCYLQLVIGTLPELGRADSSLLDEDVLRSDYMYHGDIYGNGEC